MLVQLVATDEKKKPTGGSVVVEFSFVPRVGDTIEVTDLDGLYKQDEVSPHWRVNDVLLKCTKCESFYGYENRIIAIIVYVENIDF